MGEIDDWQNVCKDNKSRTKHILQNEKLTDCQFLVGLESESDKAVTIRGHKLILAMASPVFEQIFYGSSVDEKSDKTRIPDIKPNIFSEMMDYIYMEKFEPATVEEAFELYSAANKYRLKKLMGECIIFLLQQTPQASDLWKIYEFAVSLAVSDLILVSGWAMALYAKQILEDPGLVDASLTTLIALFESDRLKIDSELDLFQALNRYALANGYLDPKNSVTNKEAEHEIEKKKLLREALKRIRFLSLKPDQFNIVAKSGLLTDSESLSILFNLVKPEITDWPMPEGFTIFRASRGLSVSGAGTLVCQIHSIIEKRC